MPLPEPPKRLPDFAAVKADVLAAMRTPQPAVIAADAGADGRQTYAALLSHLAYQCASTYRQTDYAGGCNGARIRFAPQRDWPANKGSADKALALLERVKAKHGDALSWADLIVLAGSAANEAAAGGGAAFPFCGGRTDASDGANTEHLKPRDYVNASVALKDNAKVAGLTLEEAVALEGRLRGDAQMRAAGYSGGWGGPADRLSNAYFKALLVRLRLVVGGWW